ncbi:hypothetical protein [Streptomyces anulatus]|uniref:hypothetical protein n=1 Tax=Streptomyces anulatus TaxID=1892 RepID=UPI0027E4C12A|nr:hypothetical protein [Streptomyces anulatus]
MLTIKGECCSPSWLACGCAAAPRAPNRNDEKLTVITVLALGVVIAPTPVGEGILNFLGQPATGITDSTR